jgi:predicted dehydrogenase
MTRLAFIGTGHVVHSIHLPALARLPDVQLTGGYDQSAEQLSAWQRAVGVPGFGDVDELLERARPEVVIVATPPHSHAEYCRRALAYGAHVICEKPLAADLAQVDDIAAAARAAGRGVAVNHHLRYQPIFAAVKSAVDSGQLGSLVFCQVTQLMDLPPWQEPASWRAAMADRALLEGGVHFVDLLLHLYGQTPSDVVYRHDPGPDGPAGAEGVQVMTLGFGDGRLAQLTINRLSRSATRYAELRADCERGSLRASAGGRAMLRIGMERASRTGIRLDYGRTGLAWLEQGLRRRVLARNPPKAEVQATAQLIGEALRAFGEGRVPPCGLVDARAGISVMEQAYRSAGGTRHEQAPDHAKG